MVEYLGSTEAVLLRAKKDYNKGEYQWVAQITKEPISATIRVSTKAQYAIFFNESDIIIVP